MAAAEAGPTPAPINRLRIALIVIGAIATLGGAGIFGLSQPLPNAAE